jgi:hypothetical protein
MTYDSIYEPDEGLLPRFGASTGRIRYPLGHCPFFSRVPPPS